MNPWDVLDFLNFVPIHTTLIGFLYSNTMEVCVDTYKTAKNWDNGCARFAEFLQNFSERHIYEPLSIFGGVLRCTRFTEI